MKQAKISRRSFLLGLGVLSSAALLTACSQPSSASSTALRSALPGPGVSARSCAATAASSCARRSSGTIRAAGLPLKLHCQPGGSVPRPK